MIGPALSRRHNASPSSEAYGSRHLVAHTHLSLLSSRHRRLSQRRW